jgi:signal transduction histidine kinase
MGPDRGSTDNPMSEKPIRPNECLISEQIRAALNLTSIGLLVIDKDRTIIGFNLAGRSMLNLPPDALGRDLSELAPGLPVWFGDSSGESQDEFLLELSPAAPQRRVSLVAATPDEHGSRVVMCREVSAMSADRNRSSGNEQLIRLSNFMSRISHEVRNPLASILAGLQSLERAGSLSPDDLFILGLVIGEARAATRIIERFSDSLRTGTYNVNRVPVDRFMEDCVAGLRDSAREKQVSLRLVPGSPDAWIAADEQALSRAVKNLLYNSLEASETGGLVETGWRVLTEEERQTIFPQFLGQVVVLFGRDNGCGLPRHLPEGAIFEPLVTTKPSASGLGLPVARHIVESHGGALSLHSRLSRGTEFEIFLTLGDRADCWEVMRRQRPHDGDSDPCEECEVRLGKTNEFCWAVKGRSAKSGQEFPPKACAMCAFFGTFNLVSVFKPSIRR